MSRNKTQILDHLQIKHRIDRIACQIYENNFEEDEILLVGIAGRGFILAERLADKLNQLASFKVTLLEIKLDKTAPLAHDIVVTPADISFSDQVVVLVDDVLNTGRTLIYCAHKLLEHPLKKLQTVVLVDRRHRSFPIRADFVGMTLATTIQEHISVEFKDAEDAVYLS